MFSDLPNIFNEKTLELDVIKAFKLEKLSPILVTLGHECSLTAQHCSQITENDFKNEYRIQGNMFLKTLYFERDKTIKCLETTLDIFLHIYPFIAPLLITRKGKNHWI